MVPRLFLNFDIADLTICRHPNKMFEKDGVMGQRLFSNFDILPIIEDRGPFFPIPRSSPTEGLKAEEFSGSSK